MNNTGAKRKVGVVSPPTVLNRPEVTSSRRGIDTGSGCGHSSWRRRCQRWRKCLLSRDTMSSQITKRWATMYTLSITHTHTYMYAYFSLVSLVHEHKNMLVRVQKSLNSMLNSRNSVSYNAILSTIHKSQLKTCTLVQLAWLCLIKRVCVISKVYNRQRVFYIDVQNTDSRVNVTSHFECQRGILQVYILYSLLILLVMFCSVGLCSFVYISFSWLSCVSVRWKRWLLNLSVSVRRSAGSSRGRGDWWERHWPTGGATRGWRRSRGRRQRKRRWNSEDATRKWERYVSNVSTTVHVCGVWVHTCTCMAAVWFVDVFSLSIRQRNNRESSTFLSHKQSCMPTLWQRNSRVSVHSHDVYKCIYT